VLVAVGCGVGVRVGEAVFVAVGCGVGGTGLGEAVFVAVGCGSGVLDGVATTTAAVVAGGGDTVISCGARQPARISNAPMSKR